MSAGQKAMLAETDILIIDEIFLALSEWLVAWVETYLACREKKPSLILLVGDSGQISPIPKVIKKIPMRTAVAKRAERNNVRMHHVYETMRVGSIDGGLNIGDVIVDEFDDFSFDPEKIWDKSRFAEDSAWGRYLLRVRSGFVEIDASTFEQSSLMGAVRDVVTGGTANKILAPLHKDVTRINGLAMSLFCAHHRGSLGFFDIEVRGEDSGEDSAIVGSKTEYYQKGLPSYLLRLISGAPYRLTRHIGKYSKHTEGVLRNVVWGEDDETRPVAVVLTMEDGNPLEIVMCRHEFRLEEEDYVRVQFPLSINFCAT